MRKNARKDGNQDQLIADLRSAGISVATIHQVGNGVPDIICGWRGITYLFEIKDPNKPPSKRKLTRDELDWHNQWRGQVAIVHTVEEAIKIMEEHEGTIA